jgi:hypothetical protein
VSDGEPTILASHRPGIETIIVPIPTSFAGNVEIIDVIMALTHKPVFGGLGAH